VLEVVETFKRVTGQNITYEIVERRPGDLPTSYADPSKANKKLNWKATRTLDEMCADAWRWQSNNPQGYDD
jgi:UDP-glucose 4-epimerase